MNRRLLYAAVATLALVGGLLAAWLPRLQAPVAPVWLPAGGDFTLRSAAGPLSLADLRGAVVLLYFGYTHCPDVCPTSLAVVAQALHGLTPVELERVRGLFVSVDPGRDDPARLAEYAGYFHPNIVGATAAPETIADLTRRYGVAYFIGQPDPTGNYTVDHSSYTYVIGPDGRLAALLPHATPAEELRRQVRALLP